MNFLDHLPLATISAIAADVLLLIGYLNGDLTIDQAIIAAGAANTGAGVLGHARNGAGRGVKGP